MNMLKVVIPACIIIFGLIVIMWVQMNRHKTRRCQNHSLFERNYRKRHAEVEKSASKIALLIVHTKPENKQDRETHQALAAHCIWSNVVATPYLQHRIVPVILKLEASDSNADAPPYSFCKHGHHEKCSLYNQLTLLFGNTNHVDLLLSFVCIHCPKHANLFADQMLAMKYAINHLNDTGMDFDYVCMVPSTTCLVFGWDHILIEQISAIKANLSPTRLRPVISCPAPGLQDTFKILEQNKKYWASILQAQANRNNQVQAIDNERAKSGVLDRVLNFATGGTNPDSPQSEQVYANLMSLFLRQSTLKPDTGVGDGNMLASLLWHTKTVGLWNACDTSNKNEIYKVTEPFELLKVGNDDSPSLTPWFFQGNHSFMDESCVNAMVKTFDDLLSMNASGFQDFEWSLACLSKNFVFASTLSCTGVSLATPTTLKKCVIQNVSVQFLRDWINTARIDQMVGIDFDTATDSNVAHIKSISPDTPLGLLALRFSDYLEQDVVAQQKSIGKFKNHDILARFGSYASYFSKRV